MKQNYIKESYWGKTFEGNECVKLLNRINREEGYQLSNLPDTSYHIYELNKFNNLRIQVFGTELDVGWKKSLK